VHARESQQPEAPSDLAGARPNLTQWLGLVVRQHLDGFRVGTTAQPKEVSNMVIRPDWCIRAQFMAAEALDQLIRLNWLPNPLVSGPTLSVASF
jgi:hypothetical protein